MLCKPARPRLTQFGVTQVGREILEQIDEQLRVDAPAALLRRDGEHAADEDPMGDELEPGVTEARRLGRTQYVQRVAESREHLVVDGLEDGFGGAELKEQHDEDAVVGQLLEVGGAHLVVLQQDARHDAQYLSGGQRGITLDLGFLFFVFGETTPDEHSFFFVRKMRESGLF